MLDYEKYCYYYSRLILNQTPEEPKNISCISLVFMKTNGSNIVQHWWYGFVFLYMHRI